VTFWDGWNNWSVCTDCKELKRESEVWVCPVCREVLCVYCKRIHTDHKPQQKLIAV